MRYKSFLSYLVVFIASIYISLVTDGFLLAASLNCAISFGCTDNLGVLYQIISIGARIIVFTIAYKFTKLNRIKLLLVVFVLPAIGLHVFFLTSVMYKDYTKSQYINSANNHKASVHEKEYQLYIQQHIDTKFLKLNVIVPFEVDSPINADELNLIFSSATPGDQYELTSNNACNASIHSSNSDSSKTESKTPFFQELFFIDPPANSTAAQISSFDYNRLQSYNLLSTYRPKQKLNVGRRYFVYAYLNVDSTYCSEEDFLNYQNKSSPIFIRK